MPDGITQFVRSAFRRGLVLARTFTPIGVKVGLLILGLVNTSSARAQTPSTNTAPTDPVTLAHRALNAELVAKGTTVYQSLKQRYPDAPDTGRWDIPPHAVGVFLNGGLGTTGSLEMVMPTEAWAKLSDPDRVALVEYLRGQVRDAQANSDPWTHTSSSAPAYLAEKAAVQGMGDDAWEIRIGHMDSDHYLVPDKTVLTGADYASKEAAIYVYADPKTDPVFNFDWDGGSVSQVKDYLKRTLKDPDSVQYVKWTKVIKTGDGYEVSVTYRAKNSLGGYALAVQTFDFDKAGTMTRAMARGEQ